MELRQAQHFSPVHILEYQPGAFFRTCEQSYPHSIIVTADGITAWRPRHRSEVTPDDLQQILQHPAQLIIWGSGQQFYMPAAQLRADFFAQQRGFEAMHSQAACGTFNLLLSDQRDVMAVLLID